MSTSNPVNLRCNSNLAHYSGVWRLAFGVRRSATRYSNTPIFRWVSVIVGILLLQGCANDPSSQRLAAYSVATGFLTLCDDTDYDYALSHFGQPLRDKVTSPTWVKGMQDNRGNYGIPVIRSLVTKDSQNLSGTAAEPARINFVFRTSFLGTTPGEESVSVEKVSGKWQVCDYKFKPSGKPPAHRTKVKIDKSWEVQSDDSE